MVIDWTKAVKIANGGVPVMVYYHRTRYYGFMRQIILETDGTVSIEIRVMFSQNNQCQWDYEPANRWFHLPGKTQPHEKACGSLFVGVRWGHIDIKPNSQPKLQPDGTRT